MSTPSPKWKALLVLAVCGLATPALAQQPPAPNDRASWPQPVDDHPIRWFARFDVLEYERLGNLDALRWDAAAWVGGDTNRLWIKSSADLYLASPQGGDVDLQLLYGRLISPFFDLVAGARLEQHDERTATPRRAFLAVGLQGLAPGGFDVEPELFLSNKLQVSGRFTASADYLLTQRLILQPRFETEFSLQRDEEFGVDPGFNALEGGLRLRYELWREFAPYLGLAYRSSLGASGARVVREGGTPSAWILAAGVRAWF